MKTKQFTSIIFGALTACGAITPISCCSCGATKPIVYVDTPEFPIAPYTQRFFKTPKVAKTIYTVDIPVVEPYNSLRNSWMVLLESIQGILAQTEAQLFVYSRIADRDRWFEIAKQELNFNTIPLTPEQAIQMFVEKTQTKKYVLYDKGEKNISINNATVISACDKYLMVANRSDFKKILDELGFVQADNASNYTTQQIFQKYKSQLNNTILINQDPENLWLRDYAIACKGFTTYLDYEFENPDFLEEVLSWVQKNSPVVGWTSDEIRFIDLISQYNLVCVGTNNCNNLSLYSGYYPKKNHYQYHNDKIQPEQGKHYVAIVMSDGDNVQWLQDSWETDERWFGSKKRGTFPMNWTLSPSLIDLHPQILDWINKNRTINDYFVCAHSGYGYGNYTKMVEPSSYAIASAEYMKNNDMSITYNLDPTVKDPTTMDSLLDQSQVTGVVWGYGDRYAAGKGGVHWHNNKPIVAVRETLWELDKSQPEKDFTPANIAARINQYTTNPNEISGYTLVNAHCWSYGDMNGISELVSKLDKHVQVVTAEQLFQMIIDNVPHEDVTEANDYPEYYRQ